MIDLESRRTYNIAPCKRRQHLFLKQTTYSVRSIETKLPHRFRAVTTHYNNNNYYYYYYCCPCTQHDNITRMKIFEEQCQNVPAADIRVRNFVTITYHAFLAVLLLLLSSSKVYPLPRVKLFRLRPLLLHSRRI